MSVDVARAQIRVTGWPSNPVGWGDIVGDAAEGKRDRGCRLAWDLKCGVV